MKTLGTEEVAEQLKISPETLRAWCKKKPPRITHTRLGHRYLFRQADIDEALTRGLRPAATPGRTARSQRAHQKRRQTR